LKRGCETLKIHPSIRFRTSRCLREYCSSTIFKNVAKDQDFVALDKFAAETVSKIWIWITTRAIGISDQEISDLWLFPLSSGLYRKIKPRASSQVYFASPGKIGDLMVKLDAKTVTKPFPLVDIETTHPAHSLLSMNARSQGVLSALQIQDPRRIVSFLTWLQENWSLIQNFNDEEKMSVGELLASQLSQKLTTQELTVCSDMLKQLPIFQKVSWMDVENKRFACPFPYSLTPVTNASQGAHTNMDRPKLL
jgi:sacsin